MLGSVGRRVQSLSSVMLRTIDSVLGLDSEDRSVFALDDTVTKRYGPWVEGAGIHHNPTPGPAAQEWVYGHVWVTLARVVRHTLWGDRRKALLRETLRAEIQAALSGRGQKAKLKALAERLLLLAA